MFDNIGGKIKGLAVATTIIGMVLSIIYGIFMMAVGEEMAFAGLLVAGLGCLCSWLSSFTMYALGQMVDNTDTIAYNSNRIVEQQRIIRERVDNIENRIARGISVHDDKLRTQLDEAESKRNAANAVNNFIPIERKAPVATPNGTSYCTKCGRMIDTDVCPACGTVRIV